MTGASRRRYAGAEPPARDCWGQDPAVAAAQWAAEGNDAGLPRQRSTNDLQPSAVPPAKWAAPAAGAYMHTFSAVYPFFAAAAVAASVPPAAPVSMATFAAGVPPLYPPPVLAADAVLPTAAPLAHPAAPSAAAPAAAAPAAAAPAAAPRKRKQRKNGGSGAQAQRAPDPQKGIGVPTAPQAAPLAPTAAGMPGRPPQPPQLQQQQEPQQQLQQPPQQQQQPQVSDLLQCPADESADAPAEFLAGQFDWDMARTFKNIAQAFRNSDRSVLKIESIMDRERTRKFVTLWRATPECRKPTMVFHGTKPGNLERITRFGLKHAGKDTGIAQANGSAFGTGVYTAMNVSTAENYNCGSKLMLVCAGVAVPPHADRHSLAGRPIVVFRNDEAVLPCFLVTSCRRAPHWLRSVSGRGQRAADDPEEVYEGDEEPPIEYWDGLVTALPRGSN
eukprot:TRINITY_DN5172_c0_g1_i1.p1 TRINITY_DN5172_c0_g1~~TRINITY_DN5172_c0_g1_i1.p1  ORF type:complete len:482 (+),score=122.63 TRINITY_DN5172_c0_g1_i1:112-1446(+)